MTEIRQRNSWRGHWQMPQQLVELASICVQLAPALQRASPPAGLFQSSISSAVATPVVSAPLIRALQPFLIEPDCYKEYFLQIVTSLRKLLGLRVAATIALLAVSISLFILGAQPIAVGLFDAPWDKFAHIATFALVGCAAGVASGSQGWFRVAYCVAGALALGLADELHQAYLPGRYASWADLMADTAGGLAGAGLLHFAGVLGVRQLRNR